MSVVLGWLYMREPSRTVMRQELPHFDMYRVPSYLMEKVRYMPQRLLYVVEMSGKNLNLKNFPTPLKRYYGVVFMAFTGFLGFYVAFPIFLSRYVGFSTSQVFIVYLASSIVSLLFYVAAGRLVDRLGGRKVQGLAFGLRVVIFPSIFLVTLLPIDMGTLLILICLLNGLAGMCWALLAVAGDALVARMSLRSSRSQSMGMYNSVRGVSTIFGSILGGIVAQMFGYAALFVMTSLFIVAALVLLFNTDVEGEPEEPAQTQTCDI